MNKGIYRIAAGIGAAVILVSSCTVQASMVMTNGTPAAVATDSIANWPAAPAVTSETAVLMDADTGAILYDKGMDEYRYPASTTKLMTLLIAIENSSPKDVVTFTETGVRDVTWDSSNINAQLGETMTMKDCWFAAYIKSANEVCAQIAEYVGGTEANFVEMMNQKAKKLGCTHTHFVNASGLPDENHYSCAEDLAKIMRAGLKNARFRKVLETVSHTIPATNLSAARPLHTHVPLLAKESSLYYEGCIGGKTGFSTEAQNCLAVVAERNGRTYIAVTMRDTNLGINCADSTALFDYAFNSFDSIEVDGKAIKVPKGVTAADLTMESKQKGKKTLNQYYYQGQFVGYVTVKDTPAPEPVQEAEETLAAEESEAESTPVTAQTDKADANDITASEHKSVDEQIREMRTEGISSTVKMLLIIGGAMIVVLIGLLIALYFKDR